MFPAPNQQNNFCHGDKHHKKSQCKNHAQRPQPLELIFCVPLTFAQELVAGPDGTFVPRSPVDAPNNVSGNAFLRFRRDIGTLDFQIFVFNAVGQINVNERITQAHIHGGRANVNGPVVATLFNFGPTNAVGTSVNGFLASGILTNANINPVISPEGYRFNTIASVFDAIRQGLVYINVHGSNADPTRPTFDQGIIRGEVFASQTS